MNFSKLIGHSPYDVFAYVKNQINAAMQPLADKYEAFSQIQDIDLADDEEVAWTDDEYVSFIRGILSMINCAEVNAQVVTIKNVRPQWWSINNEDVFRGYYSDTMNLFGFNTFDQNDDVRVSIALNQLNYIELVNVHVYANTTTIMKIPVTYNYAGEDEVSINISDFVASKDQFLLLNPIIKGIGRRFVFKTVNMSYDFNIYSLMDEIPDSYVASQIFNDCVDSMVRGDFSMSELQAIVNKYGGVEALGPKSHKAYQDMIPVFSTNNIVAAARLIYEMFVADEESVEKDPTFSDAPAIAQAISIGAILNGVFTVASSVVSVVLSILAPIAEKIFSAASNLVSAIWGFFTDMAGVSYKLNNDPTTVSRSVNLPFYRGAIPINRVPSFILDGLVRAGDLAKILVPGGEARLWRIPDDPKHVFIEFCPTLDYCLLPPKFQLKFKSKILDNFGNEQDNNGYVYNSPTSGKSIFAITDKTFLFNPGHMNFNINLDEFMDAIFYPITDPTDKISDGEISFRLSSAMLLFVLWLNSYQDGNATVVSIINGTYRPDDIRSYWAKLGAFKDNTPWSSFSRYEPTNEAYLNALLYQIVDCFSRFTFSNITANADEEVTDDDYYACNYYTGLSDNDVRIASALAEISNIKPMSTEYYNVINRVLSAKPSSNVGNLPGYELNVKYYSYYDSDGVYYNTRKAQYDNPGEAHYFQVNDGTLANIRSQIPFISFFEFIEDTKDVDLDDKSLFLPYSTGWYVEVPDVYPSSLITTAIITTAALAVVAIGAAVGFGLAKKKAKVKLPQDKKKIAALQKEVELKAGQPGDKTTKEYKVAYKKYMRATKRYNTKARMFGLPTYDSMTNLYSPPTISPQSPLPSGLVSNSYLEENPEYATDSNIEATSPGEERLISLITGFSTSSDSGVSETN